MKPAGTRGEFRIPVVAASLECGDSVNDRPLHRHQLGAAIFHLVRFEVMTRGTGDGIPVLGNLHIVVTLFAAGLGDTVDSHVAVDAEQVTVADHRAMMFDGELVLTEMAEETLCVRLNSIVKMTGHKVDEAVAVATRSKVRLVGPEFVVDRLGGVAGNAAHSDSTTIDRFCR